MRDELRGISATGTGGGHGVANGNANQVARDIALEIEQLTAPDARGGLQRLIDRAARRRATREASRLAEFEAERLWFWRLVKLEVERARRRDGGFSVLSVRDLGPDAQTEVSGRLRPLLRGTDALAAERDRVLILLSDTSSGQAIHVTRRLAELTDVLKQHPNWREVCFPRDALTLGSLIECLLHDDSGERLMLAG